MKKKLSILLVLVLAVTMLLSAPVLAAFEGDYYGPDEETLDCTCYDYGSQYECEYCECEGDVTYPSEDYGYEVGCVCECDCGYYHGLYGYEYCVCECDCGYYYGYYDYDYYNLDLLDELYIEIEGFSANITDDDPFIQLQIQHPILLAYNPPATAWGYNQSELPHMIPDIATIKALEFFDDVDWSEWQVSFWTLGMSISAGPGEEILYSVNQQTLRYGPVEYTIPENIVLEDNVWGTNPVFRIYFELAPVEPPDLSIVKSSNPAGGSDEAGAVIVYRGGNIEYHITVSNAGPDVATNVHVADLIPNYLIFDIANVTGHFNNDAPSANGNFSVWLFGGDYEDVGVWVDWMIYTLPAGESFTLIIPTTLSYDVPNNHIIENIAFIIGEGGEYFVEWIASNPIYHISPRVLAGALPETGIDGSVVLWTSLLAVALIATVGTSVLLKKEHGLKCLTRVTD